MKVAIYPGTFDPITNGHLDILKRASLLFNKVIVAIAIDNEKESLFKIEERKKIMEAVVKDISNVEVESFDGLLMHFVQKKKAHAIIRGLRAVSDFEYEFQLALMNKKLEKNVETIFLMTSSEYAFLSSTIIKQLVSLNGNINGLVPEIVEIALKKKFNWEKA